MYGTRVGAGAHCTLSSLAVRERDRHFVHVAAFCQAINASSKTLVFLQGVAWAVGGVRGVRENIMRFRPLYYILHDVYTHRGL